VPQNIVSQIPTNPQFSYVLLLGPLATGVPAAPRGAGLGGPVKVVAPSR
jgi:hypothetical protein